MTKTTRAEEMPIRTEADVVAVRQQVRAWATEVGFSLVDQTKLVTAASELARNTLQYGGGGQAHLELLADGARVGVRVAFVDEGPGIRSVEDALRDGFTTGNGLGLGLGGARRLVNDFDIRSAPGEGTRVVISRWK